MSLRRGTTRLAALAIPYFTWWAYRGWASYCDEHTYRALREEALAAQNLDAESAWHYAGQAANEAFHQSIFWGAYVPAALAVTLALSFWLYRGFRLKS